MISKIKKAVIWGDSVAKGVIYDEDRERYAITKLPAAEIVAEATGIEVVNHARMGMTITSGLEVARRDLSHGMTADVAVIEFGGNDCDFHWDEISRAPQEKHLPRTPADLFEKSLREAVDLARQANMKPCLLTLPPINAEKYFDFISRGLSKENILCWLGDKNHIYRFHEWYSSIISQVARDCDCTLLDIRSTFLNKWDSMQMLCSDGIHPTPAGQALIGQAITQAI